MTSSSLKAFVVIPLLLLSSSCSKEVETKGPDPIEVTVEKVVKQDVPIELEFVGETKGAIDAEVRARVEGVVTSINFQEGKPVTEGQLLYTIDPAPFLAKVSEAKAKLAEAETQQAKAESEFKRIEPLAKMKAVSEMTRDRSAAEAAASKSAVEAARALLESAEIELSYTNIKAPTSGVIGISKARVGEFVGKPPNPVILNTVSKLDPIHVRFAVNERDYLHLARMKQREVESGSPDKKRSLDLYLADGAKYEKPGQVDSVDRGIDPATGSMTVEAAFPNPDKLIRPGQFAKVKAVGETVKGALLVPKRAIREFQGESQVFVLKPDNTVEQRTVTSTASFGDKQVIASGLSQEDTVVTEGIQRLKSGMAVKPRSIG